MDEKEILDYVTSALTGGRSPLFNTDTYCKAAFTLAEGGRSPLLRADNNRRVAFTLAEVLITLGIIGIVAAMTLPTLIHKYQIKVFEARFKKSVAIISEIINRTSYDLAIENLGTYCPDGGANATQCYETINNNLVPLKKQTKVNSRKSYNISRDPNNIYTYNGKNKINNLHAITTTNVLKDGSFLGLNISEGYVSFGVDLNGYGKPNRLGHDIFLFSVSDKGKSHLDAYYNQRKHDQNITDEQATQKWEISDSIYKDFYMAIEGMPCNKTSTRTHNGIGCAYYALQNICPDDSTKTYWECLPR